jgi:hypothetical protein
MKTLDVTITPEDFRNAPLGYINAPEGGCVLWQALRRLYPKNYVSVGAWFVMIGDDNYTINRAMWGHHEDDRFAPEEKHPNGFSAEQITKLSNKAKESLEGIPTVTLTLNPYETQNRLFKFESGRSPQTLHWRSKTHMGDSRRSHRNYLQSWLLRWSHSLGRRLDI